MMNTIDHKKQTGLSLIEVMVAMVVGLILLSGVLQILTSSTVSYRMHSALLHMQENGQFAIEFLTRDIRNTDYWGCSTSLDDVTNNLNTAGPGYDPVFDSFGVGLAGTENESGGGGPLAGTDTITVGGASDVTGGRSIQPPFGPTTASPVTIGPNSNVQADDIVLVANCLAGDIFQVSAIDGNGAMSHATGGSPGNTTNNISRVYTSNAFVYLPYTRTYSIQTGASGLPTLFRVDKTNTDELVEGVENMVILYGEDTNGNGTANRYVRAASVTDMDEVVSVRIELLIQSLIDNVTPAPQAYTFNGTTTTPGDRRMRKVYSTTIELRNRSG